MAGAYIVEGMRYSLVALSIAFPLVASADFVSTQLSDDNQMQVHFEPDATVILPATVTTGALPDDKLDSFTKLEYGSMDSVKVGKLISGKRGDATWYLADVKQAWAINVDCPPALERCHRSRTMRLSELVVGGKVVAMHVDDPVEGTTTARPVPPDPIAATTEPGPLAKLVVDPAAIAKTLLEDKTTFVLGTDAAEKAVGTAAARKLLGTWSKLALALEGKPREVVKGDWGYVAANVAWTVKAKKTVMRATLYAVKVGDAWKVAGVHYSLPVRRVGY